MTAMSDFASDVDSGPNEPSLPSGVHLDMPDCAGGDCVSQVTDCVDFGCVTAGSRMLCQPPDMWHLRRLKYRSLRVRLAGNNTGRCLMPLCYSPIWREML